ncbi:hypothetical protein BYT27DRAFT_7214458 [Phlegmacium glaucopus]|nr:hypothetical protein BYT27DRAFT_7214458 [Phlegmacium glaucopus]
MPMESSSTLWGTTDNSSNTMGFYREFLCSLVELPQLQPLWMSPHDYCVDIFNRPDPEPDTDDPNRDVMMLEDSLNTIHSNTGPRSPDGANPSNPHIGQSPPFVATEPSKEAAAESDSQVIKNNENIVLMSLTPDQPSVNPLLPQSLPCALSTKPQDILDCR